MDQLLEMKNIKSEATVSTSSDEIKIPTEMQMECLKQENNDLIHSELDIKTEPYKDGNEFPVIPSTSYETCHYDDIKFEMKESLIKIEYVDLEIEAMQDPLDLGRDIKDEGHFPIYLNQSESEIKTEPKGENDENLLETDEHPDSDGSESNQSQDQLSIRNDPDRSKDRKYVCHVCNKTFTYKYVLNNHLRIHTGEKPFKCKVCRESFSQLSTLNNHMLIHSGEKLHSCNVCKKVFSRKSLLDLHKLIHSGEKSFSCNDCDKSFIRKDHLAVHKQTHTGEKPYSCDLCNKAFTRKSSVTKHRRTHTGEKPFSCDTCNKSFTQKQHLNSHKKIHRK